MTYCRYGSAFHCILLLKAAGKLFSLSTFDQKASVSSGIVAAEAIKDPCESTSIFPADMASLKPRFFEAEPFWTPMAVFTEQDVWK